MKRITATTVREQCLAILDRVDRDGIIITKHGKPVAILRPFRAESAQLIGAMKGKITINSDIRSTGAKWDVQS